MYEKSKYVVGKAQGYSHPVALVFSEVIAHSDVKSFFIEDAIESAGFWHSDQNAIHVYGHSVSLNVKSKPDMDARLIGEVIGHPAYRREYVTSGLKYVCGEIQDYFLPVLAAILIPEVVRHDQLRPIFIKDEILGAGFWRHTEEGVMAFGESQSLKVAARPKEDALLIARAIAHPSAQPLLL